MIPVLTVSWLVLSSFCFVDRNPSVEVISEMAVKKMDKEYQEKVVEKIRKHWLHRKADFTVVENLIPNLKGEGLEYSDSKDGEKVLWRFQPVHEAWQKHLEVRCASRLFSFAFPPVVADAATPNHGPPPGGRI